MNDVAKLEAINHFFKMHGVTTRRCYQPGGVCTEPAIRAHSIPSGTVLEVLCDECENALKFEDFEDSLRKEVLLTLGAR